MTALWEAAVALAHAPFVVVLVALLAGAAGVVWVTERGR